MSGLDGQRLAYVPGHFFGQLQRAFLGEVHIMGLLPVRELGLGQGMEVIDGDAVALHDVAGDLVVSLGFLGLSQGA